MAERILMNEYKTLSKEKWVNVDVCPIRALALLNFGADS